MIRINVTIEVKPEDRDRVLNMILELAGHSQKEKGCVGYDIYENSEKKDTLMIIETWENPEVLSAHEQTGHFARLVPSVRSVALVMNAEKFVF